VSGTEIGAESAHPTALTGPQVHSARQAWEALTFYASEPTATARHGRLDRLLWGLGASGHAAGLLWRDRALLRAAALPTLLSLLGAAAVAGLVAWSGGTVSDGSIELDPGQGPSPRGLQAFLVLFVAIASMPPTILQRQWMRVAHQARRALGLPPGEDPFPGEGYLTMLLREGRKTIRQAVVVSTGLLPVVAFIRLLPFGDTEAALLGAAWTFYWVVVDAFELPIEVLVGPRHQTPEPWYSRALGWLGGRSRLLGFFTWAGRMLRRLTGPWGEEVRFTERHPWETAGFAAGIGVVLAIPVAGLFFRSVAITVAAVMAMVGRLGSPIEPEGGDLTAPPAQAPPPDPSPP
jgi:hypothetical protein